MGERYSRERPWRRSRLFQSQANPAAGSDWSWVVPSGHLWELLGVSGRLVTSAAVANRTPVLTIGDGNLTLLPIQPVAAVTAGLTVDLTWLRLGPAYSRAVSQVLPLPPTTLPAGGVVAMTTALLDVGDQWSVLRLHVIDTTILDGSVDFASLPDFVVDLVATTSET